MTNIVSIEVQFEKPPKKALYKIDNNSISIEDKKDIELCPGFGNFVNTNDENIFLALFASNNKLYLLYKSLYELDHRNFSVKVKNRFFKKDIVSIFKDGKTIFEAEYNIGSFDGDIIECIYNLFSDINITNTRIKQMISFLEQTNPEKRKKVDLANFAELKRIERENKKGKYK